MILYHFTSTVHWPVIDHYGFLKTVESNVGSVSPDEFPYGAHKGPDVVWLLDTPEVGHDHGLGTSAVDKTEVRITADVLGIRWQDWTFTRAMHPNWRHKFVEIAGGEEAAKHWYIVPAPVYRRRWVEVMNVKTGEVLWKRS